jgi:hypothetical protein
MTSEAEVPGAAEDAGWELPRRKPVTEDAITRAIRAEEDRASREHRAQSAWYDRAHDAVLVMLQDGRVFGAERGRIPSLGAASLVQLARLGATEDGAFLLLDAAGGEVVRISVHGLVTRLLEESPDTTARIAAARAGRTASPAKVIAAARNGKLGGRPKKVG